MKKALLVADLGWARIPSHMIKHELEEGLLIPLKVENFNDRDQVPAYLVRLLQNPMGELAAKFCKSMARG